MSRYSEVFPDNFIGLLQGVRYRSKRAILGNRNGAHRSRKKGFGIEFSDYRAYSPGDNPRYIDWNVYARTDKLFIRQFHEEEALHVSIVLDNSLSLGCEGSVSSSKKSSKFSKLLSLAGALGGVSLLDGNSVSTHLFDDLVPHTFQGKKQTLRFLEFISQVQLNKDFSFTSFYKKSARLNRHTTFLFILSDFLSPLEEIEALVQRYIISGMTVCLVHIYNLDDVEPFQAGEVYNLSDSETGKEALVDWSEEDRTNYKKTFDTHFNALDAYCRSKGIFLSHYNYDEDVFSYLVKELPRFGFLTFI